MLSRNMTNAEYISLVEHESSTPIEVELLRRLIDAEAENTGLVELVRELNNTLAE